MTLLDAKNAVADFRDLMNQGRVDETNALVSDDFFAVFSLGKPGEFESWYYDHQFYDTIVMSILEGEYRAKYRSK